MTIGCKKTLREYIKSLMPNQDFILKETKDPNYWLVQKKGSTFIINETFLTHYSDECWCLTLMVEIGIIIRNNVKCANRMILQRWDRLDWKVIVEANLKAFIFCHIKKSMSYEMWVLLQIEKRSADLFAFSNSVTVVQFISNILTAYAYSDSTKTDIYKIKEINYLESWISVFFGKPANSKFKYIKIPGNFDYSILDILRKKNNEVSEFDLKRIRNVIDCIYHRLIDDANKPWY